uniref:Uncharacterized protein n=1 Tax=Arundo donax TaxID=35708 RepID=A0A0A9BB84_ARUDO
MTIRRTGKGEATQECSVMSLSSCSDLGEQWGLEEKISKRIGGQEASGTCGILCQFASQI